MTRPTQFGTSFPQGVGIPGGDPALPEGQPAVDCCADDAEMPDRAFETTPFIGASDGTGDLVQSRSTVFSAGGSLAFLSDPVAGHLLVAALRMRNTANDGDIPTWTRVGVAAGGATRWVNMYYTIAPGGPVNVPTTGAYNGRLTIMEFDSFGAPEDYVTDDASGTLTFTIGDVDTAGAAVLVGAVATGDPGGGGHVNYTEDPDYINVDEGSVNGGLTPESNVGYRVVGTAGTYDYVPTGSISGGGIPAYGGILGAFEIADGWYGSGPEPTDGDDLTCTQITGENVIRVWLGEAFDIARIRLVIGCENAGSKTYTLRGANVSDYSDAVTVATIIFTATGSFTSDIVTDSWSPLDSYEFWELTGDDETRNLCSFELYEASQSFDTTAIDAAIDALEVVTDPVTGLFVTKSDGGLENLQAHGAAGATETLDLADGNWHSLTLNADCTITVTGFTTGMGCSALVKVTQDGSGGHAIVWDSDILFAGDDQPAQGSGEVCFFMLVSDEGDSTIYGFPVGGSGTGPTFGTPAIVLGTVAAAGSSDEVIRRDSTIVAFDATVPVTQAFSDAAATGSAAVAARRDHVHGMPADPSTSGHYEVMMDGGSPPAALESGSGTDWLYVFVP